MQFVQSFGEAHLTHSNPDITDKNSSPRLLAVTERLSFDNELNMDKTVYSALNAL